MSAYPSLLNPLMNAQGLITTSSLNTEAQTALALSATNEANIIVLQDIALQTKDDVYTGATGSSMVIDGDVSCNVLNYTSLNPPIAPGATPSLSEVLTVSGNGGNKPISNIETLYANNVITSGVGLEAPQVAILKQNQSGYYYQTSNASGVDLNTKFTSDGLILHKVNAGSDITIQNDANNLVTLGTATGYADLQVGVLNYQSLNPPIPPSSTPTLAEVLAAGNDGGTYAIVNISQVTAKDSLQILKDADQPELGTYSLASGTTGFNVGEGASLTANTLIGGSPDGIAFQNADASFTVDSAGNISCNQINSVSPQFKPTYDYYVAKGGNDNNLGSVLSPFLTVQKAIQVCETAYDGTPRVIHLSSGTYSENITIVKPRISIVGEGASMNPDVGSSISGTVLINLTDGNSDLNNNNIYFSGLLINGAITDQTYGIVHRLFFTNCYLYASADVLTLHPAITLDYRVIINNCTISNSSSSATNSLMAFYGAGMISITNCKITSKGASQKTLYITDNVRVDTFAQNILTSDGTGNNVAKCIMQHDSSSTISIGQNAFVYSSSGTKRNIDGASAVNMTSSGSLVAINNLVALTGLPTGQMAFYNTGSGVIIFGNNISTSSPAGTSASGISGTLNVNKFACTSLQ